MGSLKPGATYIYERVADVVYAREMGAPPEDRFVVGYKYEPPTEGFKTWAKKFADDYLWDDIMSEAETNPALQTALENVKIIYYLSKKDGNSKT